MPPEMAREMARADRYWRQIATGRYVVPPAMVRAMARADRYWRRIADCVCRVGGAE